MMLVDMVMSVWLNMREMTLCRVLEKAVGMYMVADIGMSVRLNMREMTLCMVMEKTVGMSL